MKRIKDGIAFITMFGLMLGTASVATAKTAPLHHAKMLQITTKSAHQAKSVHESAKYNCKNVTKNA